MADSDSTARGYQFFEQDTGIARYIKPRYVVPHQAWATVPTEHDVSGIDVSNKPIGLIDFDLNATEEHYRATIINYGYTTLGQNLAPYVNALPPDFMRQHLFNVAYNRPILMDALRLRTGGQLTTNPYAAGPYFLTMYLLRAYAKQLTDTTSTAFKVRGNKLNAVADHLRFALDRILINHNLSDLPGNILLDVLEITQKDEDQTVTNRHQTLYIATSQFNAWAAKGGDELLLVAQWGLYGKDVDDQTIADSASIMAAWEASQNPPLT